MGVRWACTAHPLRRLHQANRSLLEGVLYREGTRRRHCTNERSLQQQQQIIEVARRAVDPQSLLLLATLLPLLLA
jgi:hypothetical protein